MNLELSLPVMTNCGLSPRPGVLMYVFVFCRSSFILHPKFNVLEVFFTVIVLSLFGDLITRNYQAVLWIFRGQKTQKVPKTFSIEF